MHGRAPWEALADCLVLTTIGPRPRTQLLIADEPEGAPVHHRRSPGLGVSREGTSSTLVGDVTLGCGTTLLTSIGDVPGWMSMAGFVFLIIFQAVTERRARQAPRS